MISARSVKLILTAAAIAISFSPFASAENDAKYAMSYVYFGNEEAQIQSAAVSADVINTVSPSYFDINTDGTLNTSAISLTFINAMKDRGLKVVPFISNHWNRQAGIKALYNIDSVTSQIADTVLQYDLDGVNVDLENLTENERDLHTEFVRSLREKLPEDREVSVAVAANPRGFTAGWHASYDYAALGEASDHLFIMAYDEHYQGGSHGPVASIDFVEQSIQYALKYVEAQKIVLGIPFFGRIWGGNSAANGNGLSLTVIESYKNLYDTAYTFDEETCSPVLNLTLKDSETRPKISGATLPAGNYMIYYENADSIKLKLALVDKYNLKGAGNWSAGQEPVDIWDYYGIWLSGSGDQFIDISDSYAKEDILKITSQGIMTGISVIRFEPGKPLTRAQAAAICVRLLDLPVSPSSSSHDVPPDHWAADEIAASISHGILYGYPDGSFQPEKPVTRAEMSTILFRLTGASYLPEQEVAFSDVADTHWATGEISSLAQIGIINGYTDGSFRPDRSLTRAEMASILSRVLNIM